MAIKIPRSYYDSLDPERKKRMSIVQKQPVYEMPPIRYEKNTCY